MYTLNHIIEIEYPVLLQIWEASVRETHLFLSENDIQFYKALIQENKVFEQVHLRGVRNEKNDIIGFMGVAGEKLEMLFLQPGARGKGIGKMLLQHAIEVLGVTTVDVNEQNEQALGFYKHYGFKVKSRSEFDDTGRPFPIIHLKLV
jgi:putative acetyltransferase